MVPQGWHARKKYILVAGEGELLAGWQTSRLTRMKNITEVVHARRAVDESIVWVPIIKEDNEHRVMNRT